MGRKLMITAMAAAVGLTACPKASDDASTATTPKTLYVATGACNSGQGVTTYTVGTASKTIERFGADNGANKGTLIDYTVSNFLTATHPQNLIDYGSELLVLNENATSTAERRVIRIPKADPLNYKVYYANTTALNGIMRGLARDYDGSMLIGKTTAVEKISPAPIRILANALPWINNPAGTCTGSNLLTSSLQVTAPLISLGATSGKIIFTHHGSAAGAGATTDKRLGIIKHSGYFAAADCANGYQISTIPGYVMASNLASKAIAFNAAGTSPTSSVYIPTGAPLGSVTGKLIVSLSNSQTSNNAAGVYNLNHGIVMYDVTETDLATITISNPVVLFDDFTVVYGASAMAYDPATSSLYVAVGGEPGIAAANYATANVGYNIEKFSLNLTNSTLTRVAPNNQPFIRGNANTKCISSMSLGE